MVMTAVQVFDADTHVFETEATWEFMPDSARQFKPRLVPGVPPERFREYWEVDGWRAPVLPADEWGTTKETRELLDVGARLRDMDRLGTSVQVLYPTLLLSELTDDPEGERALKGSYNRWLADRCAESNGRLRWVYLPYTRNLEASIAELGWAKEHGAVGVLKKGDREAGHWPAEPYFFPLYAEAEKLDLPVCLHSGNSIVRFPQEQEMPFGGMLTNEGPILYACHSLIHQGVPDRFPGLRFGFIEAGSNWLPHILYNLARRLEKRAGRDLTLMGDTDLAAVRFDLAGQYRMYVTCQVDEDLPYIMRYCGEDTLMVGSDYSHPDVSEEIEFQRRLRQRADQGEISAQVARKLTSDNARRFYGL